MNTADRALFLDLIAELKQADIKALPDELMVRIKHALKGDSEVSRDTERMQQVWVPAAILEGDLAPAGKERYPRTTNATAIVQSLRPTSETLSGNPEISIGEQPVVRNPQRIEGENMKNEQQDLHAEIMNLPCAVPNGFEINQSLAYKIGHRDARHAAAELAALSRPQEAQTRDAALEEAAKVCDDMQRVNDFGDGDGFRDPRDCAEAIRALKAQPAPQEQAKIIDGVTALFPKGAALEAAKASEQAALTDEQCSHEFSIDPLLKISVCEKCTMTETRAILQAAQPVQRHGWPHDFKLYTVERVRDALTTLGVATDDSLEVFSADLESHMLALCRCVAAMKERITSHPAVAQPQGDLPPLPKPYAGVYEGNYWSHTPNHILSGRDVFTTEQMREYARAAQQKGIPEGWISVDEQLPKPFLPVLVQLKPKRKNSKPKFAVAIYCVYKPGVHDVEEPGWFDESAQDEVEVIRWTVIPAAPTQQGTGEQK